MSKDSRNGGKFTGKHTTLIELAAIACDIADACPQVTKISPGFIVSGTKSVNGNTRVKISDSGGIILLSVRGNISVQDVRIYTTNIQTARTAIARGLRNAGVAICFKKRGLVATQQELRLFGWFLFLK